MTFQLFFLCTGLILLASINSQSQTTPDSAQVYPNPFCQNATVEFGLTTHDTISLTLFDVTGQSVQTLLDSTALPSGSFAINILGDSLSAGIYILKLEYGNNQQKIMQVIKQCDATGIDDYVVSNALFYPNPCNTFLVLPIDGTKRVEIVNGLGVICSSFTTQHKTVSLEQLSSGRYYVRVYSEAFKATLTQTIVVQK